MAEVRTIRTDRGVETLALAVKDAPPRGAIARGLGRAYGDSAQNGGGLVIQLDGGTQRIALDPESGTVTASAAVSLDALMRHTIPQGFFVPVTPGTRFVTVGGAVASDIHGKNHHADGSFGSHVTRLSLMLADGTIVEIGPHQRPDLFWATVGGMGLTGVIIDVTFTLIPVQTSRCVIDTHRVGDLDTLMSMMHEGDAGFRYSVAWIDTMAKGRHLGRGVLTRGDHARLDQLPGRQRATPRHFNPRPIVAVPFVPPVSMVNWATIKAFNEMWYRKSPRERVGEVQRITKFFYPLDAVGNWNRLYGPHGFVQYQFVVPFGQETALRTVMERFSSTGTPCFLAVLKRLGPANQAPLSFPRPGWTLALDIPASARDLSALLHGLDEIVQTAGGRLYLAKDGVTTSGSFHRGYPRLAEWREVCDEIDPAGVWISDQARRLRLRSDDSRRANP